MRKKYSKITGFGHFVITNLSDKVKKSDLILADTLCHYIGDLFSNGHYQDSWFPATYLYKDNSNFDFFEKLSSERHFNKVKFIFDVSTIEEFKKVLVEYKEKKKDMQNVRYSNGYHSIPFLFEIIILENVGVNR